MIKSLLPHKGDRLSFSTIHPYKDVLLQMMGEKDCLFFWAVEKAPTRDEFTEENKCNLFLGEARPFCWVFQYSYQGVHKRFPVSILYLRVYEKCRKLTQLMTNVQISKKIFLLSTWRARIKLFLPNRLSKFSPELIFLKYILPERWKWYLLKYNTPLLWYINLYKYR